MHVPHMHVMSSHRSVNCPQHMEEQRVELRSILLGKIQQAIEPSQHFLPIIS